MTDSQQELLQQKRIISLQHTGQQEKTAVYTKNGMDEPGKFVLVILS